MYLETSLMLIGGLALGIFFMVARKFPYLKKLPVDMETKTAHSFFSDFFPELYHRLRKVDLSSYRAYFLCEFEKLLRRIKVLSLKLEALSNSLIHKIKANNHYSPDLANGVQTKSTPPTEELHITRLVKKETVIDYKKEEQSLIIEIAKDPKNPELYRRLGDIYLSMKNFLDAKESLTTALKLDPENDTAKKKLAKAQTMLPM